MSQHHKQVKRSKARVDHLLSGHAKSYTHGTGGPGMLATLFNKILIEGSGVKTPEWNHLVDEYARREVGNSDNRRDLATAKGNLIKELLRSTMSIKVFLKGLMFLRAKRIKFIAIVEWEDKHRPTTQHSVIVEVAKAVSRPTPTMKRTSTQTALFDEDQENHHDPEQGQPNDHVAQPSRLYNGPAFGEEPNLLPNAFGQAPELPPAPGKQPPAAPLITPWPLYVRPSAESSADV